MSRQPDLEWVRRKEKKSFGNFDFVSGWAGEGADRGRGLAWHSSWERVGSAESR